MYKKKHYYWFLQIDENPKTRFEEKYKGMKSLTLYKNERILNKLAKEGVTKICFICDMDTINFNKDIPILFLHAYSKGIKCEILFYNNVFANYYDFCHRLSNVDEVTFCLDAIDNNTNKELGRSEYYAELIKQNIETFLLSGIKVNIMTMLNSKNIDKESDFTNLLGDYGINTWKLVDFMPILLNKELDEDKLCVSKINCRTHFDSFTMLDNKIKSLSTITESLISLYVNIILPNGDIAMINGNDSIIIGNILKDNFEQIDKSYNRTRRKLLSKIKSSNVKVYIANENKKIIDEITNEIKDKPFIEIVGTSTKGKQALEEVINLKPDILFTQYDFKDITGDEFSDKMVKGLKVDCPSVYLFANNIYNCLDKVEEYDKYYKLGCWLGNNKNYNKNMISNVVKKYKLFRDLDF